MQKTNTQITKEIHAILFYLSEPVSYSYLSKILDIKESEVREAVSNLSEFLRDSGMCIVEHDKEIVLTTSPEMAKIVEKVIKDERERDLGKASMETLAIIAYKGPVSRKEIEYIRGVNCQFALRTLLLRGLVDKKNKENDERSFVYNITMETLTHLGLQNIKDLPEYDSMRKKVEVEAETEDQETEKIENNQLDSFEQEENDR